jgi:hypothetical protein
MPTSDEDPLSASQLRRHRTAWGLADQALSSSTNFALSLFVAHSVTPTQFGSFALALSVYFLIAGIGQGVASGPLAVRYSAAPPDIFRAAARKAAGTAFVLGLVTGTFCVLVAIQIQPPIRLPLIALGVMLPGLLLQDTWRFVFVAAGRPGQAALNDSVWTIAQILGFIGLLAANRITTENLIGAWGFAAAVAAGIGCLQARELPEVLATVSWLRHESHLAFRYAMESIVARGSVQISVMLIAGITGLGALGGLRGAQVIFSPLNFAYLGGLFVAVPEAVRILHRAPERLDRLANLVSFVAVVCAVTWTVVALIITAIAGRQLLGETWVIASTLLLSVALQTIGSAASIGPQVGLRGLGAAKRSLSCQVAFGVAVIAGATTGAVTTGIRGAAIGIALGTWLATAIWWLAYKRERRARQLSSRPIDRDLDAMSWTRRDS